MSAQVLAALIAGISTVIVGLLGYFGHKVTRGLDSINLRIDRLEAKLDRLDEKIDRTTDAFDSRVHALSETQTGIRERLVRIETLEGPGIWKPAEGRP